MDTEIQKKEVLYNIIQLFLTGKTEREICHITGITLPELRKIMHTPVFEDLYNEILIDIKKRLTDKVEGIVEYAFSKLTELMNSADERISLEAVKTALKVKWGDTPVVKMDVNTPDNKQDEDIITIAIKNRKERELDS